MLPHTYPTFPNPDYMHITKHTLLLCLALAVTVARAQTEPFTQREQQSISVETPGLFDRSTGFIVDFGQMTERDYSFPLPVGKVEGQRKNQNIIIATTEGDAVRSMFAGTVRLSRQLGQWGNVVVVRHDNGLETVYANNAQNLVKVGERVKAGQTVAIVGTREGKAYCEFAIMANGARVNPETLIELKSHRLRRHTLLFEKQEQGVKITVASEEREQRVERGKRRKPSPGNMTRTETRRVTETQASQRYAAGTEHVAEQHSDDEQLDINEYQAIQFEEKYFRNTSSATEFTVDFRNIKDDEWCYPLKGARVISPFGGRRRHAGSDLKSTAGEPVYAAFDGEVTLSGTHYGYGLCIVIKHDNGLETLYSHQSKNTVKKGERVKAGQQIGVVGRTGRATTDHCHFETRCFGRTFDSSRIFDHAKNELRRQRFIFRKAGYRVTISAD